MNSQFEKYHNFISLGYCCPVASDLERLGLRNASYPFDWILSNWESVLMLINNSFDGFLDYDLMLQHKKYHHYYYNRKYKLWFFHDFNQYDSLDKQLPLVQNKYTRRIERFYKDIKTPTLFVRYISDGQCDESGKSLELIYIEKHYDEIIKLLKSYCDDNDILFIANKGVRSDLIKIYNVTPDKNKNTADSPFSTCELEDQLKSFKYDGREQNLKMYQKKDSNKKNIINRIVRRASRTIRNMVNKDYIHNNQIEKVDKV